MRKKIKLTALVMILAICLTLFIGCGMSVEYYADSDSYQVGSGKIIGTLRSLDISWTSGSVSITQHDGEEIVLTETEVSDAENRMRYRLENGVLTVYYQDSGIHFDTPKKKDLQILIPREQATALQKLAVETSAASVNLTNLNIQKVEAETASGSFKSNGCVFNTCEVETASGDVSIKACTVDTLKLETASGEIAFDGSLQRLEAESASGNISIASTASPLRIEAESASGNIDLTVPADSKFTAEYDCASGDISIIGFSGNYQSDKFICGSSTNKYTLEAASGNITIRAY